MTDQTLLTLASSVITCFSATVAATFAYLGSKRGKENGKKADQIHVLVNNAMQIVLLRVMDLTAWKASVTKDPNDIAAAIEARRVVENQKSITGTLPGQAIEPMS